MAQSEPSTWTLSPFVLFLPIYPHVPERIILADHGPSFLCHRTKASCDEPRGPMDDGCSLGLLVLATLATLDPLKPPILCSHPLSTLLRVLFFNLLLPFFTALVIFPDTLPHPAMRADFSGVTSAHLVRSPARALTEFVNIFLSGGGGESLCPMCGYHVFSLPSQQTVPVTVSTHWVTDSHKIIQENLMSWCFLEHDTLWEPIQLDQCFLGCTVESPLFSG